MPVASPDLSLPACRGSWKWWVCGLLLLATMINYMDRLTLNQTAPLIMEDPAFQMSYSQYGLIESAFGIAFAIGSLVVGYLVDRWNVWWMYPAGVLVWSAAGFATGFASGFVALLVCRFALGLAEGSNWPCALRTTQRILQPAERTLGNSILQSGAAVGAILTPLLVISLVPWTETWRLPFLVVGTLGLFWVGLWLVVVRREDLALPPRGAAAEAGPSGTAGTDSFLAVFHDVRFYVLAVVVVCINITWHFFRAWMPLFLQRVHGYSLVETNLFSMAYYLATDAGSLAAGFATLWLARRGLGVRPSRLLVFSTCTVLTTLALVVGSLGSGPVLLGTLLLIGFGCLGLFPNYYSFSQDLTFRHQGKLTGTLGFTCWLSLAGLHWVVGRSVDETGSYALGLGIAGLTPLIALAALLLFWKQPATAWQVPLHAANGELQPQPTETHVKVLETNLKAQEPHAAEEQSAVKL